MMRRLDVSVCIENLLSWRGISGNDLWSCAVGAPEVVVSLFRCFLFCGTKRGMWVEGMADQEGERLLLAQTFCTARRRAATQEVQMEKHRMM